MVSFSTRRSVECTQNRVYELQPFSGHLALNSAGFLIRGIHHVQTMLGLTHVILVFGIRRNCHDPSFLPALQTLPRIERASLFKRDHSQIQEGLVGMERGQYLDTLILPRAYGNMGAH